MKKLTPKQTEKLYREAVARYIASRRQRIPEFTQEHFSLKGSARLHRHAIGWDLIKAPVNAGASVLTALQNLGAKALEIGGAPQHAAKIKSKALFITTEVSEQINQRIYEQLLELPYQGAAPAFVDGLMAEILNASEIQALYRATLETLAHADDKAALEQKLTEAFADYAHSRTAAADIAVAFAATAEGAFTGLNEAIASTVGWWYILVATGFVLLHKVTPGLASLSTAIAQSLAQSVAAHTFWAGPWAGRLYYGVAGASATPLLSIGTFTTVLIPAALVATFSGIATDPIQLKLGMHDKRLNALLDNLEKVLLGEEGVEISVKEHYIARILDVLDWLAIAAKSIKP